MVVWFPGLSFSLMLGFLEFFLSLAWELREVGIHEGPWSIRVFWGIGLGW